MEILGYFLSILIGLTLGLIGAGGSILTIPLLVYVFKINPLVATTYSFFIVGTVALIGSVKQFRLGNLKLKPALFFAIPSIFSLLLVKNFLLPKLPNEILLINDFLVSKNLLIMILFAIVMILASISMIKKQYISPNINQQTSIFKLSIIGFFIGILIGILGIGGGFLIIPALILFAKLNFKQAIGTSLLIIFVNSLIGFTNDVLNHVILDYRLLFVITAIAIVGMLIGTEISKKINNEKLKTTFGWFVLIMGCYIIFKELIKF
jgi:uncharacterized protein